jgi:hypothetical protein
MTAILRALLPAPPFETLNAPASADSQAPGLNFKSFFRLNL